MTLQGIADGLHYEVHGDLEDGRAAVLLSSGLGGSGAFWAPQMAALTQRWPADAPAFKAGFDRLSQEFDALDSAFRELTPGLKQRVMFTSHPAYGYLARRYGWSMRSVPLPPDAMPAPEVWEAVRKEIAAPGSRVRLMLFESDPLPVIRDRLQTEWQILAVVFSPCETPPTGGNYFTQMQMNVESLRRAVGQAHF